MDFSDYPGEFMNHIRIVSFDPSGISMQLGSVVQHIGTGGFHLPEATMHGFDLHYFTDGSAQFRINGKDSAVTTGEIVIRGPGDQTSAAFDRPLSVFHCHFSLGKSKVVTVDFKRNHSMKDLRKFLHQSKVIFLPDHLAIQEQGKASELWGEIISSWKLGRPGAQAKASGIFLIFLHLLTEETLTALHENNPQVIGDSAAYAHVHRAISLIDGRLHQPVALDEVAQCIRINPDYLSRIFKRYTGNTLGEFVLSRKIERAKGLLLGAPMSIKEIAQSLGIKDQLYFGRMFKKATGITPGTYRKKQR
jgi:AraC-like DNA-binding protein